LLSSGGGCAPDEPVSSAAAARQGNPVAGAGLVSSRSEPRQPSFKKRARLLLAEDNPTLRSIVATLLEGEGYETLLAANGEEAMRLAMEQLDSLDLLLTDDQMPGMNGYELIRVLKSIRPDLRVIVMSGSGVPAAAPDAAILLKPFAFDELLRLIVSELAGAGGRRVPPWPKL
jgi:CheY-like chemotaxis protein